MVIFVFEVKIERLDHQGRGICKINNKITFVPNALIDEIVNVEIIEEKKKYNIGKVVNYIKKSDLRVNPICPYYELCGGCDLMHLKYNEQLKYKQDKIKNFFSKYADVDLNLIKDIVYDKEYNYRNKGTFKVNEKVGYYGKNSHKIISIDNGAYKLVTVNEVGITPITVTKNGNLYVGTYKGATHYFDPRGGGGNEPLTLELCKKYNLSCGAW